MPTPSTSAPESASQLAKLTVADLMSREVHTVRPEEPLRDTHSRMRMTRIRHLPVVDGDQRLVGIISERDLFLGWSQGPESPISEVMSRSSSWVHPTTPAAEAAQRLIREKIGCLPVLDDDHHVVGIITDTDFLHVAQRALTALEMMAAG